MDPFTVFSIPASRRAGNKLFGLHALFERGIFYLYLIHAFSPCEICA